MSHHGGKKRRFRRSFDSSRIRDDAPDRDHAGVPSNRVDPQTPSAPSHCQRCQLPLIGDFFDIAIESEQGRKRFQLCQPCAESMNRWLSRPQRDAQKPRREPGSRRLRPAEVVDSLVTRRRSKENQERWTGRFNRKALRRHIFTIVGAVITLGVFAVLIGAIIMLSTTSAANR